MIKSFGFDLSYHRLVDDAANLCRWNPTEAMKWFDAARVRAVYPIQVDAYNRAVKRARTTLDSIESSSYYNKEYSDTFWGENSTPTRPQFIEVDRTLEEKLSLANS